MELHKDGIHVKVQFQPQDLSGVGQITGDKYQGTGVSHWHSNVKVGENYTLVENFRIIGQGSGNNYLVHITFHFTVNANGILTVWVDNFREECK